MTLRSCVAAPVLVALVLLATGCQWFQGTILEQCVEGPEQVVLVDRSESADFEVVREAQRDVVASVVETAVDECSHLTIAAFGGTNSDLDVIVARLAQPEGSNSTVRAENGSLLASEVLAAAEWAWAGPSLPGGSDPVSAIAWACDELAGSGRIVVATDGMVTTPVNVTSHDLTMEAAASAGESVGSGYFANRCEGDIEFAIVGVGRSGESVPSAIVAALRHFWSVACANGGFAKCYATEIDAEMDGAGDRVEAKGS